MGDRGEKNSGARLADLFGQLAVSEQYSCLREVWRASTGGECTGCFAAAPAFFLARLQHEAPRKWVAILPSEHLAHQFYLRMETFLPGGTKFFPAFEVLEDDEYPPTPEIAGARMKVLQGLLEKDETPIITDRLALLQDVPTPNRLGASSLTLAKKVEIDPDGLAAWLVKNGYEPSDPVLERGTFSRRGGIIDIFSGTAANPIRLEFDGDEICSLREFNLSSQRSIGQISKFVLFPLGRTKEDVTGFFDYLDESWFMIWPEPTDPAIITQTKSGAPACPSVFFSPFSGASYPELPQVPLSCLSLERFSYQLSENKDKFPLLDMIPRWLKQDLLVLIVVRNEGEENRFREIIADRGISPGNRLRIFIGELDQGFYWEDGGVVLIPDSQVFSRYRYLRPRRSLGGGEVVRRPADLKPGDYVVHLEYGVGRYLGISELEDGQGKLPKLQIQYAQEGRLYLPPSQIKYLSRYMGIGGAPPRLDRLGGGRWKRAKAAAELAVARLADELLEIQASRSILNGHAFNPDGSWQIEFENAFPFEETPDQSRTLIEVKKDMESSRPMDRLICGDVGYGKTEVAIRAAFKAVMGGKQVAVLVPTTVLALQHLRTFKDRMADYPIRVEMLSRLVPSGQQEKTLAGLKDKTVDVVIGTHRLLQKDVSFQELGLVVIDEEQRFGVRHKERFKQLRSLIDILTMTATPIPRTLYMALTGARELSNISTPPQARLAVRTKVAPYQVETVRHAIARELNREGQVFYLFNRVEGIAGAAARIQKLFPQARLAIAHGQMPQRQLSSVMDKYVAGAIDILVCTTIIESGLDIPNANTLLVERADRFGLADLYQLRGRVGRMDRRAYAYFLYPRTGGLSPQARSRLKAIEEFSQLGAGYDLSLRDLEIRGAGNILGREQHGHILAVGFELYCRLLADSIARRRGENPPRPPEVALEFETPGFIPDSYIASERDRIEIYRRWTGICNEEDLQAWEEELADRFGPLPSEVVAMRTETILRLVADQAGISSIASHQNKFVLKTQEQIIGLIKVPPRAAVSEVAALSWLVKKVKAKELDRIKKTS